MKKENKKPSAKSQNIWKINMSRQKNVCVNIKKLNSIHTFFESNRWTKFQMWINIFVCCLSLFFSRWHFYYVRLFFVLLNYVARCCGVTINFSPFLGAVFVFCSWFLFIKYSIAGVAVRFNGISTELLFILFNSMYYEWLLFARCHCCVVKLFYFFFCSFFFYSSIPFNSSGSEFIVY